MRRLLACVGAVVWCGVSGAFAVEPVQPLQEDAAALFAVENGTVETVRDDTGTLYRWRPDAGKTSTLAFRSDHPLLQRLRYYDDFRFDFRIASGQVSATSLWALGHVSGARQFRVHQWQVAVLTTPTNVWHRHFIELSRPNWFPWDQADGTDGDQYFRFTALALEAGTVLEIRAAVLTRALLRLKADFLPPESWPLLTRHDDGGATYRLSHWLQNASGAPATVTAQIVSPHTRFRVGLAVGAASDEIDESALSTAVSFPLKHAARGEVRVVATLDAKAATDWEELGAEPLEIMFALDTAPEATVLWQGMLTRPLSSSLRRQVIVGDATLAALREALAREPERTAARLDLAAIRRTADALLKTDFLCLPRSSAHVRNDWVGSWRPTDRMPEIVNTATGVKEFGTELAGRTWKENLAQRGNGCEHLALAYLYTGNEAYAQKAVELFLLHAREFRELPWTIQSETPWARGDFILGASRIAWNSTYGSNRYYKNHCRLLSAISGSAAWTPEVADRVYRGFVIPYAMELMKFRGGLSNMTDMTNHNILLLGLVFGDAGLVRWALWSDPGLLNRLTDITADGFSSEGRPVTYHYGAMQEFVPSLAYLARAGLKVSLPSERLAEAVLMPFRRASLWGRIPSTGDCGRGLQIGPTSLADQMLEIVPESRELALVRRGTSLDRLVAAAAPVPADAWKQLLESEPRLFAEAGMAILRSGDTPETQVMATLDYGRNVFHAHLDRNQFTLLAFGKAFTMGPGSSYNVGSGGLLPPENPDLRAFCGGGSLGQNVIMIDTRDQEPAVGQLLGWSGDPARCWAAAAVEGVRPGVRHERAVLLQHGVIVLLDRVISDDEHLYDWVYHNLGTLQLGEGWTAKPLSEPLATRSLYDKLVDAARLAGNGPLQATWDLTWNVSPQIRRQHEAAGTTPDPVRLAFWQAAVPEREIYSAKTGINNRDTTRMPDTAPSLICRVRGKTVAWVTVLEPFKEKPRVTAIERLGEHGVSVRLIDGTSLTATWQSLITEP